MKASELLLKAGKSSNPVFVDLRAAWCRPDNVNQSLLDHTITLGISASVIIMNWDTATWWALPGGLQVTIIGLYAHPPQ